MNIDIVEKLNSEMAICNACRLFRLKVKKVNSLLPNDIIEHILTYIRCKRCMKTLKILKQRPPRWEGNSQQNTWYFLQSNRFPMNKVLTAEFPNFTDNTYNRKYSDYSQTYRYLYSLIGMPQECKTFMLKVLDFMFSSKYKKLEYSMVFNDQFLKEMKEWLEVKIISNR